MFYAAPCLLRLPMFLKFLVTVTTLDLAGCCMCPGVDVVGAGRLHAMGVHPTSSKSGKLMCYVVIILSDICVVTRLSQLDTFRA